ncbi:MAG: hypothetical protein CMQ73_05190 [Gammaproteobacteria bacterium]|nr:hypothetical protein [Gammaproteobacteria bacterium]OUT94040.1 MAG: hypothetical protein CBB96_06835 [Gammaproteobacteria bacterium TMED36]|tara:strand:- start:1237 stop:1461 length:225 start_codon:yes stop_codon:yes gene_type:complete
MRKIIGLILFFGSWLVYAVLVFIAVDSEWSIAEKLGIGTALYGISWATMIIGSILLGPEFIERIKIMIRPKNKK